MSFSSMNEGSKSWRSSKISYEILQEISLKWPVGMAFLLVLLVNDSEYSKSTGAKPILSPGCIFLVFPGALRAPTPPRPLLGGREVPIKRKPPASALALGHFCVGVGEVGNYEYIRGYIRWA
jgi:hypothetical protein